MGCSVVFGVSSTPSLVLWSRWFGSHCHCITPNKSLPLLIDGVSAGLSGRSTNFFTQWLLSWSRTQPHVGLGTRRYFSETVERNWQGSRQLPTQLDAPTFTLDYITHCCISHMTPWKAAYERNLSEAWLGSKVR